MDTILQQAIAGDSDAWRQLVEEHTARLRRYLHRRMGSQLHRFCSESDLTQDVFMRMFRALPSAPGDATERTFRRWLFRHADWVLASRGFASRRHHGESVAGAADALPAPGQATGAVTRQDEVAWLRRLVDRLAPKFADVVRLRLDGHSFADIATRLGVDEAAVRQRFSRVLRVLKESHLEP